MGPTAHTAAPEPHFAAKEHLEEGREGAQAHDVDGALAKMGRRVVPLCFAVALMNYLDRSNLAYSALSFNRDNGFDAKTYSLGSSLFFVGLCVFQVPSNLVMVRVGFRPWLAFLLCGWGVIALSFMFIKSAWSFYVLRLLLGVFESGAFPAMWYALSVFFPRKRVIKPYALLTVAIMIANMIGGPLAAGLLAMNGLGGLKGWQWLFLMEGIPSIVLGVIVFLMLPGSIASARFLTPEEKLALEAEVARDHVPGPMVAQDLRGALSLIRMVLRNGYFWPLCIGGVLTSVAAATYVTFTPIIISNLLNGTALSNQATVAAAQGTNPLLPVALAVVPYSLAAILALAVAHSSQRRDEMFLHIASCVLFAGVLITLFWPLAKASVVAGFISLSLSLASCFASNGPGMALIARLCRGREQVVAQPMVNTFNILGSIVGPLLSGALINKLGGFTWVTVILGLFMVTTGLLLLGLRAWVMHDGGLPEGGTARRPSDAARANGTSNGTS